MSEEPTFPWQLQDALHPSWDQFVDFIGPFRPRLHQYCRRLTGNVWDGEDLVQDAIVRVFATLGKRHALVPNARGYLVRTATNLWIDQTRRAARAAAIHAEMAKEAEMPAPNERAADVRAAAQELMHRLTPQERAAVLMKDVFDLSLEETATILHTTTGAVKAALHRGRERLRDIDIEAPCSRPAPPREAVDRLMAAFATRDVAAVNAVVSEDIAVELVGGAVAQGREESQMFFWFSMNPHPGTGGEADIPSFELRVFDDEPLILGFRPQNGINGLNEIHRVEVADGNIVGIRCYCFCPDTLAYFGELLGRPVNQRPYRSPSLS